MLFTRNPAIWISLIGAALAMAVGFGLKVTGVQIELIMTFMGLFIPIVIGIVTRSQVYPVESVQTALDAKPGTSIAQLDKIIEKQN